MRLSLWQQWSSNHSASFTVVGQFDSVESANAAEVELKSILLEITAWRERPENLDEEGQVRYYGGEPITPPEEALAERYEVAWSETAIDWIYSSAAVDDAIIRLDNFVFVTSLINETWLGPKPFDVIMGKLGGRVSVVGEAGDWRIDVTISCQAPSQAVADELEEELAYYFATPIHLRPPWQPTPNQVTLTLRDGTQFRASAKELEAADAWWKEIQAEQFEKLARWRETEAIKRLMEQMGEASKSRDADRVQELQEEMQRLMVSQPDLNVTFQLMQSDDEETQKRVAMAHFASLSALSSDVKALSGQVKRTGAHVTVEGVAFFKVAFGLGAVLRYLSGKGCSDIQYEFHEEGYGYDIT